MKIATWNVNSVRARLDRLLAWLAKAQPDVVCLQETKATDDVFPVEPIREAGYHAAVHGQKSYNGVAILARCEPANVHRGVRDDGDDPQARLIEADVGSVRVICGYFPQGESIESGKFAYKLEWIRDLRAMLDRRYSPDDPVLLCGDFNVARDDKDVASPKKWAGTVICCDDVRAAMESVRQWGFTDVFRKHHPEGGIYSWWDYRGAVFQRDDGLRVDHIFATQPLAARCVSADVDRNERAGEKPSDHAPVIAVFETGD